MLQQIHTDTEKREPDEEDRRIRKASEMVKIQILLKLFFTWKIRIYSNFFDLILIPTDLCF